MTGNPSPEPPPTGYASAPMMAAMGMASAVARQSIMDWGRPYILTGPEPDMNQSDVAVVAHVAALAKYYVKPLPGMVLRLESIAFSSSQPQWFVSYNDMDGNHVFHEASGGGYVCHTLAGFIAILDRCRLRMPDRFQQEAA